MKKNIFLENLTALADAMSAQFGSNCEVSVHDLFAKNSEKTLVYIVNGHVTGRKKGSSPSKIVLESLEHLSKGQKLENKLSYRTTTKDGRLLKSSTMFFSDENGNQRYMIAINLDITALVHIDDNLSTLIGADNNTDNDSISIPGTVGDLLDDLLKQSSKLIGKEPALMSKDEKIKAIRFLNDSGAFLIMKSGDRIAEYFGLSKYTLYSYAEINKPH